MRGSALDRLDPMGNGDMGRNGRDGVGVFGPAIDGVDVGAKLGGFAHDVGEQPRFDCGCDEGFAVLGRPNDVVVVAPKWHG